MMTVAVTAAELAGDIRQAAGGRQRLIVGIVGAPGAGKSTLADQLDALLSYDAVLVPPPRSGTFSATTGSPGRQGSSAKAGNVTGRSRPSPPMALQYLCAVCRRRTGEAG